MLRFAALLAALLVSVPASAQDAGEPSAGLDAVLSARDADRRGQAQPREREAPRSQPGSVAILRGLDKVTARTLDFEAPVGETVAFGALDVTVRYCRKRPPEEPPEVFTFIQVADRRTDGFGVETEGERIFSGWMFASNPALNPLEHPVYDVWVIDCRT